MRDGGWISVPVPFPSGFGERMVARLPISLALSFVSLTFKLHFAGMPRHHDMSFAAVLMSFLCGVLLVLMALGAIKAMAINNPSHWLPFLTFLTLDVFVGLFSICSLFVRTPPCLRFMDHLNWRKPSNAMYLYGINDPVFGNAAEVPLFPPHSRGPATLLTLCFAALLLPKFYLVMCGWRGYKAMKFGRWGKWQP